MSFVKHGRLLKPSMTLKFSNNQEFTYSQLQIIYKYRNCNSDFRKFSTSRINSNSIYDIKEQLITTSNQENIPLWFTKLKLKQEKLPFHAIFRTLIKNPASIKDAEISSNLQHFLSFLTIPTAKPNDTSSSNDAAKTIKNPNSIESSIMYIVHSIIGASFPKYSNPVIDSCIQDNIIKYNLKPNDLFISKEVMSDIIFGEEIVKNPKFQVCLQILKNRLIEDLGWSSKVECRDDNLVIWINSLFQNSNSKCLINLTKSKFIPDIIVYDLLLRKPENELEFKYFLEFYKNNSTFLNLLDQEKLYYLKQMSSTFNRDLIIPLLFDNFFKFSIRSNLEKLPILIDLFLNENNISSFNSLEQISEMVWYLSFDNSGEHFTKPSRYYNISQSKLIKIINRMIENNKSLGIDITTMLGVSNLTYFKDFRKSFDLFKNAKNKFNIDKVDFNNDVKVDYNIKFLCNSILLLSINPKNKEMITQDLTNIFTKIEPKILIRYPEIWNFVIIKLSLHNLLNEQIISNLIQEYLKNHKLLNLNNYFILDLIINKTEKISTLLSLLENLKIQNFDDNNISHLISKFYKFAKNSSEIDLKTYNCLDIARDIYNDQKDFKSTRLNSSYLLGESIFSPENTFKRYNSINKYFKTTQLTISSLFLSVYKLNEKGIKDLKWDDVEPIEFSINEFNKYISTSYGDSLLYPNDNLLTIYIKVLKIFGKTKELDELIFKLIDLKYPLGLNLFNSYLECFNTYDKDELIRCLNEYDLQFKKLTNCKNEFELLKVKERLPVIKGHGKFDKFIDNLAINWSIIRRWKWPGRDY